MCVHTTGEVKTMKKAAKKATPSKKTAKPVKKVRSATVAADKLLGGKTQKVVRNSESGRFTDKAAAKRDPKGTETEKVTRKTKVAALKMPKSLPACVDLYDALRAERLAIQKQAEEIGKKEAELREHLINNMSKADGSGVGGKLKKAVVV